MVFSFGTLARKSYYYTILVEASVLFAIQIAVITIVFTEGHYKRRVNHAQTQRSVCFKIPERRP